MKDPATGWVEATIIINGQTLTFAESLTLRVAVSTFHMSLTSKEGRHLLGPIGDNYLGHCERLHELIFRNNP